MWAVRHSLTDDGHEVLTAYDGMEALSVARSHRPDLVVLDITMPRLDGLQVCNGLRGDPALASVPILFLTERTAIEDRVAGLDGGGDDYVVKPFDLRELRSRIGALLRRKGSPEHGVPRQRSAWLVTVGSLVLDRRTRRVSARGVESQLTPVEFDLLHYLMTHQGELFSAQQLLEQVWGYPPDTADPSLVRWHIRNLRAKIEPDPDDPEYIRTVPRHGYMLLAGDGGGSAAI